MMIIFTKGDLFESRAEALVNPVNCVGVMGAGLALIFKNKFHENYMTYKDQCDKGNIKIGSVFITGNRKNGYIINFPTKDHWKNPSKLEYIDEGLSDLANKIVGYELESIDIPALGCGLGGLDWKYVKPLIQNKLHDSAFARANLSDNVKITVYEPPK